MCLLSLSKRGAAAPPPNKVRRDEASKRLHLAAPFGCCSGAACAYLHLLSSPKAPAISTDGSKITAPLANTRQSISAGTANASKIEAMILVVHQAILKASFTEPIKSQSVKIVTKISKLLLIKPLITATLEVNSLKIR